MDLLWVLHCVLTSACVWVCGADRHLVFWNSSNPEFELEEYVVEVRLNDYLDIVCPHYPLGTTSQQAERYVLYMVEQEDYGACRPQSYDQMRWECSQPFAPHAAEKFSEKFQRFTPFTLGREFRPGQSYYYISRPLHHYGKECLKLRVDVIANDGSQEARVGTGKGTKTKGSGGDHTTSNKLPDDPDPEFPNVEKSVRTNRAVAPGSTAVLTTLPPLLLLLLVMQ